MTLSSPLVRAYTSGEKERMRTSSYGMPSTRQMEWEETRKDQGYMVTLKVTSTMIECMFAENIYTKQG